MDHIFGFMGTFILALGVCAIQSGRLLPRLKINEDHNPRSQPRTGRNVSAA